jgi:predicted ABC-type ATPase
MAKDIIILGGPNGAGKTTAARVLLPNELGIREFVNADEIARGLSPFNEAGVAVAAGRVMIKRMHDLVGAGESFAFETTCAGQAHIPLLRQCRANGWRVTLLYLWLPSPEAALARVARRVKEGDHAIPADIVVRRYWKGLSNMRRLYLPLADVALIYDNGDMGRSLIAERRSSSIFTIHDNARWTVIEKATA